VAIRRNTAVALLTVSAWLSAAGCSSEDGLSEGSGGGGVSGGTGPTGGAVPTGGLLPTGGMGAVSSGGLGGTGGVPPTGGVLPTGGVGPLPTGGAGPLPTGGAGAIATGGAGAVATGGVGAVATGGAGAVATGGVGAVATGGAATGGIDGTGGVATGGVGTGGTGEPEMHIYLAVGQSNMQGAAFLPDEPVFHDRVLVMQDMNCPASDGNPYGYGEWREMFPPLIKCNEGTRDYGPGQSGPIGLGPADSFAVAMAEAAPENVTIGIVGAAYGDTSIEMHLPNCTGQCLPSWGGNIDGAPVVNGTTLLYDWVVDLAKKAQQVGVIKGIIFHQGENNAGDQSWPSKVNTYVTSLRNDLNLDPAEVPFIAGELPYTGGSAASHNPIVRQIPDYVENGHYVSAGPMEDGTVLGDRGDGIHWSTFSVIEMGKRYAAKMLEVSN